MNELHHSSVDKPNMVQLQLLILQSVSVACVFPRLFSGDHGLNMLLSMVSVRSLLPVYMYMYMYMYIRSVVGYE